MSCVTFLYTIAQLCLVYFVQVENYLVTSLQRRHSVIQQTGENNNADVCCVHMFDTEFQLFNIR